jgi:hypothetical protein
MLCFDVYGQRVGVMRAGSGWAAVFVGDGGKSREAPGVVIPPWVGESELEQFLADLLHEGATAERPDVVRLPDIPRAGRDS